MKTVIVTGSQGFIGGYICSELLKLGYHVIGYDNYSKYGPVKRNHDGHPNFELVKLDLSNTWPFFEEYKPDYIIAGAAMIGGISYFHKYAYDLVVTNERILANTFDSALCCDDLKRIVVISSSMVYEGAEKLDGLTGQAYPTNERHMEIMPPPQSTYGAQKLMAEYYARGAWEQYGLPYTIVRPFNCVGIGEEESEADSEVYSGNVKLRLSHVLPDLINKCLKGQDPLHILGDGSQVRCYTHGADIARGIVMAMEHPNGKVMDFNISTNRATTVLELAKMVWERVNPDKPFRYTCDDPYTYDVRHRVPDTERAKRLLGFEATISLEESVDEVIHYMRNHENCTS